MLYELGLCASIGGIQLGLKRTGAIRTICYVEYNPYRQSVLAARMRDGWLDDAPIWDDVTTFDGTPWRGRVSLLTAGFPCQPFSLGGKRHGEDDERYLWPAICRAIREVRPRYVLLENVPGLLMANRGRPAPIGRVLADLSSCGYDAEWDCLPASAFGAPHRRERLFLLAYPYQERRTRVLCPDLLQRVQAYHHSIWPAPNPLGTVWDTLTRMEQSVGEPAVLRSNDGLTYQVDRLAAIGEAVVPLIAAYIGYCILADMKRSVSL